MPRPDLAGWADPSSVLHPRLLSSSLLLQTAILSKPTTFKIAALNLQADDSAPSTPASFVFNSVRSFTLGQFLPDGHFAEFVLPGGFAATTHASRDSLWNLSVWRIDAMRAAVCRNSKGSIVSGI
jgi:hypothetical protein